MPEIDFPDIVASSFDGLGCVASTGTVECLCLQIAGGKIVSTVIEPLARPSFVEEIIVRNPKTGETLYTIRDADEQGIAHSYDIAREAFGKIRSMTISERVAESDKLLKYILRNREAIIDAICAETGKARMDALLSEIFSTLGTISYFQKSAAKILNDRKTPTPIILEKKKSVIFYQPMGPVLIISPWNYPFYTTMSPFICAFLAGNSVIYKPSEYTPLRGLFEKIVEESGFMKGALQVVYGGKDTGRRLIDGRPAKVFFTGSTRAGRQIMAHAAQYLIPVELELGGKDPMIVFDDVDIERTVNGALWGGMTNCGQTCTSVERIYVQDKIFTEFTNQLKQKASKLRTVATNVDADPKEIDIGVMTTDFQVGIVEDHVGDARARGAEILATSARNANSQVLAPTIVTRVDKSMKITYEETFGPVVTVEPFRTEDEVIARANDSPYGLSASVWSRDLERAQRVARNLEVGNVSINNVLSTQANPALPFGGTKDSGFGRYNGEFGLHSFCHLKSVMIEPQRNELELHWYPYSKEKYHLFSTLLDALYDGGPFGLLKAARAGLKLKALVKRKRL